MHRNASSEASNSSQQLALTLGRMHHATMNAYSEDLRKKIVEAKERGMPTTEVARAFGVGLSSVKRYVKTTREGGSLRPKSSPGRRPKANESARSLLEADLEERPAATLAQRCEYLRNAAGLRVSESTVSRLLRRLGWTRKKEQWVRANATGG
jgi:transposase